MPRRVRMGACYYGKGCVWECHKGWWDKNRYEGEGAHGDFGICKGAEEFWGAQGI